VIFFLHEDGRHVGIPARMKLKVTGFRDFAHVYDFHSALYSQGHFFDLSSSPKPIPLLTYLQRHFSNRADSQRWHNIKICEVPAAKYVALFREFGEHADHSIAKLRMDSQHCAPVRSVADFLQTETSSSN